MKKRIIIDFIIQSKLHLFKKRGNHRNFALSHIYFLVSHLDVYAFPESGGGSENRRVNLKSD